ncbi:unnamed protein product [Schistosoma rodhaini]|uniref:Myotrophin n=1 Tax=Schistosoma rodhaini TaxID=6188 RepID=A0AA85FVI2_9TREM|nr:unnamed protein product [Schistosoma rodhaini]
MPSEQLLWAVKNGDLQSIKENMKNCSGVNSTFKNGRTLIHYAADYGQKEICDYLIRNGADINVNDGFGVTPLLAAIYEGHIDCVSLLLNNGIFPSFVHTVFHNNIADKQKLNHVY